jgi:heme oxygenase (biliverdin-IX-beta and delta-forming)
LPRFGVAPRQTRRRPIYWDDAGGTPLTDSTDDGPLAAALRAATQPTHAALERRLDLAGGSWTRARYAAFLRATLAVVAGLEAEVAHLLEDRLPRWEARRSARLHADLLRLGADARVEADGVRRPRTPAEAFGAAYVVQGSQLGAPFIARALADQLCLQEADMTYLRPQSAEGPVWTDFVAALNRFGRESPDARPQVLAAARRTFGDFERAFLREGFA